MRIASQFAFSTPSITLRRHVLEFDEAGILSNLFSLDNQRVESAHTLFLDGIVSTQFTSLKMIMSPSEICHLTEDYYYIDVCADNIMPTRSHQPLILDFGSINAVEINSRLPKLESLIPHYSLYKIIAACVYYPALLVGKEVELAIGKKFVPLLWQNVDLVNKRILTGTCLKSL